MSKRICAITTACPSEHDTWRSQYPGPEWGHNTRHFKCFMPSPVVTLWPALLGMVRRQHGPLGMHCQNSLTHFWHCHVHQVKMLCILLRGLSSCCMTGPTHAQTFTRLDENSLQIPPTRAALEQHVKRATYQGGHIWGQSLLATPALPLPTSWGWMKTEDGLYESNWTTLPEASKACYELVSCKVQEGLCETLQMQEGCTWVHAQLWRGVFTELTMCTDIISVIW